MFRGPLNRWIPPTEEVAYNICSIFVFPFAKHNTWTSGAGIVEGGIIYYIKTYMSHNIKSFIIVIRIVGRKVILQLQDQVNDVDTERVKTTSM